MISIRWGGGSAVAGLLGVGLGVCCLSASAADYRETLDGDLSNSRATPTALVLGAGNNVIAGAFGGGDLDYIAVTLPASHTLDAIVVGNGTVFGGIRSFIGVQAGPVMTVDPSSGSASGLLGWTHFDLGTYNTNILPAIGQGFGASGFVPPLGTGTDRTYTFWIQETGAAGAAFELNFQVSAAAVTAAHQVPVTPPVALAALAGLLGLAGAVRARALNARNGAALPWKKVTRTHRSRRTSCNR